MFTPATDYNQQLLASLQILRQLLDQLTAMATAGMAFPAAPFAIPPAPFMPPGAQFMPPTPPTPTAPVPSPSPAPTDYAQQLFGHLQAWRQHLEQLANGSPGSPQASPVQWPAAQPTDTSGNQNQPVAAGRTAPAAGAPNASAPSGGGTEGQTTLRSAARQGSDPNWPPRALAPDSYFTSQISGSRFDPTALFDPDRPFDPTGPFDGRSAEHLVLTAPDNYFENQFNGPPTKAQSAAAEVLGQQAVGSAFRSVMEHVDFSASPQVVAKSLFSAPEA